MDRMKKLLTHLTDRSDNNSEEGLPSHLSVNGDNDQHSAEGFLCPVCMVAFSSSDVLKDHYETLHVEVQNKDNSDEVLDPRVVELQKSNEELVGKITELQNYIGDGVINTCALSDQIDNLEARLQSKVEELCEKENSALMEESKYKDEIDKLQSRIKELEQKSQTLEEDKTNLLKTVEDVSNKLAEKEALEADAQRHLQLLSESTQAQQNEIESTGGAYCFEDKGIQKLKDDLDVILRQRDTLQKEVIKLKIEKEKLENEKKESEKQLKLLDEKVRKQIQLYKELELSKKEIVNEYENKLKVFDKQESHNKEEINTLASKLDQLNKEKLEMENQCKIMEQNAQKNLQLNEDLDLKIKKLVKDHEAKLEVYIRQESAQRNEIKNFLLQVDQLVKEKSESDLRCKSLDESFQKYLQLNQDLELSLQALQNEKEKWTNDYQKQESTFKKEISDLSSKLDKLANEKTKSETEKKLLTANMEKCAQLNQELEKRMKVLVDEHEQELKNYKKKESAHENEVAELNSKILTITRDKNESEKSLKTLAEEKSLLLERVLRGETEADALKASQAELRRKHEDTLSALQELGREHQSLQIEHAKVSGRKWTSDTEVASCTSCLKDFSLTVRKHHCRHCGKIYCNDCSSKTASVPSSKKPVRVCDQCFDELTSK